MQICRQNACLLHVYTELYDFQMLHCTPGLDIEAEHHRAWVYAQGMPQDSYNALSKIDLEIHTEDYDGWEICYKKNDGFDQPDKEFE